MKQDYKEIATTVANDPASYKLCSVCGAVVDKQAPTCPDCINRSVMSRVRTLRKKVAEAVTAKDKDAAAVAYNNFASAIDKAAKKGTVPANRAANYKSKAAKALASIA